MIQHWPLPLVGVTVVATVVGAAVDGIVGTVVASVATVVSLVVATAISNKKYNYINIKIKTQYRLHVIKTLCIKFETCHKSFIPSSRMLTYN